MGAEIHYSLKTLATILRPGIHPETSTPAHSAGARSCCLALSCGIVSHVIRKNGTCALWPMRIASQHQLESTGARGGWLTPTVEGPQRFHHGIGMITDPIAVQDVRLCSHHPLHRHGAVTATQGRPGIDDTVVPRNLQPLFM
jgi:hypothetical protein